MVQIHTHTYTQLLSHTGQMTDSSRSALEFLFSKPFEDRAQAESMCAQFNNSPSCLGLSWGDSLFLSLWVLIYGAIRMVESSVYLSIIALHLPNLCSICQPDNNFAFASLAFWLTTIVKWRSLSIWLIRLVYGVCASSNAYLRWLSLPSERICLLDFPLTCSKIMTRDCCCCCCCWYFD